MSDPHKRPRGDTRAPDAVEHVRQGWQREVPDLPLGSVGVITRVWRIAKLLLDDRTRLLADLGMDGATLDLLSVLRRGGPPYALTPSEIGRRTLVTPGAISQRITRAESRGYVRRTPSGTDGRGVLVHLTEDGRREGERVARAVLEHDHALVADLTPTELAELEATLMSLQHLVEKKIPHGEGLM